MPRKEPLKRWVFRRLQKTRRSGADVTWRAIGRRAVKTKRVPDIGINNSVKKAKTHNTDTAPQAAYHSCSHAFVSRDRSGVQPIGCRLSPRWRTLTCNQTAVRSPVCRLMVSTLVIHVIRDGRLSLPGWLIHSRHFNHKMVTCQP